MKKAIGKTFTVILLIAAVFIGLSSLVITQENEYKVIRQFGKIDHVQTQAGISFKVPFIQTESSLPKQILMYDLSPSDVITKDKKTMITDSFVLWQITDPVKFAQTLNSSIGNAEGRIDTVVYNSIKNIISSLPQEEVISGRDGELSEAIMTNVGDKFS